MPTKKGISNDGIIGSPEPKKSTRKKTVSKPLNNDIIGSDIPKLETLAAAPKPRKETVALYSTRHVVWEGVGKIEKGYSIVSKTDADKWLTRGHTRLATPEELAREYGA
jgi:hypothetical protein